VVAEWSKRTMFTQVLDRSQKMGGSNPGGGAISCAYVDLMRGNFSSFAINIYMYMVVAAVSKGNGYAVYIVNIMNNLSVFCVYMI
jgi:hypothetical protein